MSSEHLVFVDESGVNTNMTRIYARSRVGFRAKGDAPLRYSHLTILGAMRSSGETQMCTIDTGTTKEVFDAFTEQMLIPFLRPGDIVVWDIAGAWIHHCGYRSK